MPVEIDYEFGKTAVRLGLLKQEQLEECIEVLVALERVGSRKRLWDVVAGKGYMNGEAIRDVRAEGGQKTQGRLALRGEQFVVRPAGEAREPMPAPPPAPAEFVLAHLAGEGYMRLLPVSLQATTIGKSPGCDVVLQTPTVSEHHAKLAPTPGGFKITDTGSENGTLVNNRSVTSCELEPNDLVQLGAARLLLLVDYGEEGAPMPTGPHVVAGGPVARLRITDGPGAGTTFFLGRHPLVIGKHRLANGRLEDASVSNFHVHLALTADGFLLTDLKSKQGTMVNGLTTAQQVLRHEDRVAIGPCKFSFEMLERPAAPADVGVAAGEVPTEDSEWDVPIDAEVEPTTDMTIKAGARAVPQERAAEQAVKPYRPGEFMLTCVEGAMADQRFVLVQERTVIGRSPDSGIPLQDASVSRRHAEIVLGPAQAEIRDLNSKNGVAVNGTRVAGAVLHSGDAIRLGNSLFIAEEVSPGRGD